ncbi:MAG TPA: hypothetical protein VIY48_15180 [Candidatus Paceibacterota bacterium]
MTEMIPVRPGKPNQRVSLAELQERLDARREIAESRTPTSTRKARVESAKQVFLADPETTVAQIQARARALSKTFDPRINLSSIPLSQDQKNQLSDEYYQLERLKVEIEALETRYKTLVFAHLDETVTRVPGRPASQTPGKVEAEGPGPHYIFERRGGNRANPSMDTEGLRKALPTHLAEMIYKTVHHPSVEAWDEENVFDEAEFGRLVDAGLIDLDVVAEYLTPGPWRTPALYKTLMVSEE